MLAHRPGFVAPTLAARQIATLDHFSGGMLPRAEETNTVRPFRSATLRMVERGPTRIPSCVPEPTRVATIFSEGSPTAAASTGKSPAGARSTAPARCASNSGAAPESSPSDMHKVRRPELSPLRPAHEYRQPDRLIPASRCSSPPRFARCEWTSKQAARRKVHAMHAAATGMTLKQIRS